MKDKFLLYKLIRNVTYPIRPWFYSPFKGEKGGLPRYKTHWNFIQSSTRMLVERDFGMLKGRFRILLKRINIPLRHMPNLVTTCICLLNMCIANLDGFDMDWALEVQKETQTKVNSTFGNIKRTNLFKVVEETVKEMKRLQNPRIMDDDRIDMKDIKHQHEDEDVITIENNPSNKTKEERIKNMLTEVMATHELFAKNFFEIHLRKNGNVAFLNK